MKENKMLGKDGLTVTSANHLANIAKEMYEAIEAKLHSLKFYNKDFTLAVNGNSYRVENESDKEELAALVEGLKKIGELKSLIAYLREGIKAKASLDTDNAFEKHIEELVNGGREELKKPSAENDVTFEDELLKLTPEQRARYYALEARCATIGAFIHPEGAFALARAAYFEHKKNPTKVNGRGQDAEICTFSTTFTSEEIDKEFFFLQKEYRSLQAEFNKMKSDLEQKVKDANIEIASEAYASIERWSSARKLERKLYDEQVKALKIVIPQNLKGIYDEVNKVSADK